MNNIFNFVISMKIKWIIEEEDIKNIKNFYDSQINRPFVKKRINKNLSSPIPEFSIQEFWYGIISCLITTQQRSGPDSPVSRFINTKPFPLGYYKCRNESILNKFVEDTITNFGGLRRSKTLGDEIQYNMKWLESGGWRLEG